MQDQTRQKRSKISQQLNHYGLERNFKRNTWAILKII